MNGNTKNNIILANAAPVTHNFSPFLDTRKDVDPKQRYKALGAENIINSPIGAIDHTVFYPLEVKDKRSIRHKYNISQKGY